MNTAISFYVDGSSKPSPGTKGRGLMGAGIVGRCGHHQKEWSVPLGPGTNQLAEVLAVREALKVMGDRPNYAVTIYSDSLYAVRVLTQHHTVKVHSEIIDDTKALIAECDDFRMFHVSGHSGDPLNELAHKLAIQAASSQDPSLMPPPPPKLPKVSDQLREIADQIVPGEIFRTPTDKVREAYLHEHRSVPNQIVVGKNYEIPLPEIRETLRRAEDYEAQTAHLENLVDELVQALRYYADNLTYLKDPERPEFIPPIVRDKGYKARQLLMANNIPLAEDPFDDRSSAEAREGVAF